MPCPVCNLAEEGASPRTPEVFKTEVDEDG
jgi:hypothetical protein